MIEEHDQDKLAQFFCLAWGFWFRRNKLEFEKIKLSPNHVANHGVALLHSFKIVSVMSQVHIRKHVTWRPPPIGVRKLNTDGVMFGDLKKVGISVILKDASGNVVMAASCVENEVEDPEAIELLAVFRGF